MTGSFDEALAEARRRAPEYRRWWSARPVGSEPEPPWSAGDEALMARLAPVDSWWLRSVADERDRVRALVLEAGGALADLAAGDGPVAEVCRRLAAAGQERVGELTTLAGSVRDSGERVVETLAQASRRALTEPGPSDAGWPTRHGMLLHRLREGLADAAGTWCPGETGAWRSGEVDAVPAGRAGTWRPGQAGVWCPGEGGCSPPASPWLAGEVGGSSPDRWLPGDGPGPGDGPDPGDRWPPGADGPGGGRLPDAEVAGRWQPLSPGPGAEAAPSRSAGSTGPPPVGVVLPDTGGRRPGTERGVRVAWLTDPPPHPTPLADPRCRPPGPRSPAK